MQYIPCGVRGPASWEGSIRFRAGARRQEPGVRTAFEVEPHVEESKFQLCMLVIIMQKCQAKQHHTKYHCEVFEVAIHHPIQSVYHLTT